jgi:alpha-N-acetylglucosaminidase
MEKNARLQITSWAQPETDDLTQYAYKLWSGMPKDFYLPRWQRFYDLVRESIIEKKPLDKNKLKKQVVETEKTWISEQNIYPVVPQGSTAEISRRLFDKYATHFPVKLE